MIRTFGVPPALLAVLLSGCASSLSGVGGMDNYACKAPEGVMCNSVSGVYANSIHGNLRPAPPAKSPSTAPVVYGAASVALSQPAAPGTGGNAMRSTPRVLRVWIAPWEDSDGDLHEEGYLHVIIDTGRWLIEHVRPAVRGGIDGVAPPAATGISPTKPQTDSETPERLPAPPSAPGVAPSER